MFRTLKGAAVKANLPQFSRPLALLAARKPPVAASGSYHGRLRRPAPDPK